METRRPVSPGAEEILGLYFPVLDHGFVALVDYMGNDECIERAARVSYGHGTRKTESDARTVALPCGAICTPRRARWWSSSSTARCRCSLRDSGFGIEVPVWRVMPSLLSTFPVPADAGAGSCTSVRIDEFFKRWTHGTTHPIVKKKPGYLECVDAESTRTPFPSLHVWCIGVKKR